MDYKTAGVDIKSEEKAIQSLAKHVKKTFKNRSGVLAGFGHYANLLDIGGGKAIAMSTDGVGSKVLVAEMMGKYDTVPIDMIAMNVNDLICIGAEPVALVDYMAVKKPSPKVFEQIGRGLEKGCREAGIVLLGGETASLPQIIKGFGEDAFDLAGTAIGIVEKNKLVLGNKIRNGDKILGLESSGIHSNGLSLARKVLLEKHSAKDPLPTDPSISIGDELLKPTKIYVKQILALLKQKLQVRGLAHITGSGFLKLRRLNKKASFVIDSLPEEKPVFEAIRKMGNVDFVEMHRTFNMGIGFCVVVSPKDAEKAKKFLSKHGKVYEIGHVKLDGKNTVEVLGKKL